jgi:glycosyltransferase involved in cell wall biosynthesis
LKLLVVSHTPHYLRGGRVVGFGPTVRELSHLAGLFDSLVHLAPLHRGEAPESALTYEGPFADRVELRPLPPMGGDGPLAKLGILLRAPELSRRLRREVAAADAWHVRAPANISLLAMAFFPVFPPRPCWVKYAGNWRPEGKEPWSYGWQRRWLARPRPGVAVTVNGRWPNDPPHVEAFRNPSFTAAELAAARAGGERRLPAAGEKLGLLFVGRLDEPKGAGRAIEILAALRRGGVEARLELAGGGGERESFEALAVHLGVAPDVHFAGELPRPALAELYRKAHFLLLPSRSSEGWPKVLSEAMAHGALPLAGAVSSISQGLADAGAGRALPPLEVDAFLAAIRDYLARPGLYAAESLRARESAADFTYDRHLAAVRQLFETRWKLQLAP